MKADEVLLMLTMISGKKLNGKKDATPSIDFLKEEIGHTFTDARADEILQDWENRGLYDYRFYREENLLRKGWFTRAGGELAERVIALYGGFFGLITHVDKEVDPIAPVACKECTHYSHGRPIRCKAFPIVRDLQMDFRHPHEMNPDGKCAEFFPTAKFVTVLIHLYEVNRV